MKTLMKYPLLLSFFLISSGVIAQPIAVEVTITDNCGAAGSYTVHAWVYCTSNSTNYCYAATLCTNCSTGPNYNLNFSCSVPLDSSHEIYEVKIYAYKNGATSCNGQGVSIPYNTDDLYGINIPVSVTLR